MNYYRPEADLSAVLSLLGAKADTSYLDEQLLLKADLSYLLATAQAIQQSLDDRVTLDNFSSFAGATNTRIDEKADQSDLTQTLVTISQLTTDNISEAEQLYFTNARAVAALTGTLAGYLTLGGNGSGLTGLTKGQVGLSNVPNVDATNAGNLSAGTINAARLPSLSSTYLSLAAGGIVTGSTRFTTGVLFGPVLGAYATLTHGLLDLETNDGTLQLNADSGIVWNNGFGGTLAVNSSGVAAPALNVGGGKLQANTTGVGVYGVPPVARQSGTTDIKDALTSYGWLQGTSATPLNLDGGTLTAGIVYASTVNASYFTNDGGVGITMDGENQYMSFQVNGNDMFTAYSGDVEFNLPASFYDAIYAYSNAAFYGNAEFEGDIYCDANAVISGDLTVSGSANLNNITTAQGSQTHSALMQASDLFGQNFCRVLGMNHSSSGRTITFPAGEWAYVRGKRVYLTSSQSVTVPANTRTGIWLDTNGSFHVGTAWTFNSSGGTDATSPSNGAYLLVVQTDSSGFTLIYDYSYILPAPAFTANTMTLANRTLTLDDYSGGSGFQVYGDFWVAVGVDGNRRSLLGWSDDGLGNGLMVDKIGGGNISFYRNSSNIWQANASVNVLGTVQASKAIVLGSQTTAPTATEGTIYYNTSDQKFYGRLSSSWVALN